ncbi:G-protein coupled receptor 143 isoform X2 [Monomorium pharaonis]|uniref:G-protein coupled receptor 143 isoform X2 n=1 Tax=Monomorium pharaonis TaxID=307658 RepID=UPI00063FA6A2|nr:G-protein coupled receptor 143 isoform X2 [Monomorium pharaonis]
MADPTLQTFCCHHTNRTDRAIALMQEFNTDAYNTVCMLSATMGMIGAIYQILPREDSNSSYRWRSFSRGRDIIVWLAVADLLASLGVFVRSALWRNFKSIMPMEGDMPNVVFCAFLSAWIQYFYMATWIWTLCYAVDMKLLLGDKNGRPTCYHTLAWVLPAVLTSFGLIILYIPDANCHSLTSLSSAILRILPNYFATYVLLAVVMIVNPILYVASTRDLETAVLHSMAQMTSRERRLIQTIRLKFALINVVYYVCWTPNLINGVLLWTLWFQLPIKAIITLWYIMAVTNPLQAFFNAIVYQSWTRREKLRFECCQDVKSSTNINLNTIVKIDSDVHISESSPLLSSQTKQKIPHISINGSSSL